MYKFYHILYAGNYPNKTSNILWVRVLHSLHCCGAFEMYMPPSLMLPCMAGHFAMHGVHLYPSPIPYYIIYIIYI